MSSTPLHAAVESGDVERVRGVLANTDAARAALLVLDAHDCTPLMRAVANGSLPITHALLQADADPCTVAHARGDLPRSLLAYALSAGDPRIVAALLDAGADLHYAREGYGALLDAVHGRDILRDPQLLALLRLLLDRGARLNDVSPYRESALRTLSRAGRFDAVALLLDAGADEAQLGWNALLRAVAIGTLADVERELARDPALEQRDWWSRTAWHVALIGADVDKAERLRAAGADIRATGRCRMPALFYAIHSRSPDCIRYALSTRPPLEQVDQFGGTALMEAAAIGDADAVALLLAAGACVDFEKVWQAADAAAIDPAMAAVLVDARGGTALSETADAAVARRLLDAGADPQQLTFEARRGLLGLPPEPTTRLLDSTEAQYRAGRERRFGTANPERIEEPHWLAMIRSGIDAYHADQRYDAAHAGVRPTPGWCARRFGQSLTFLPDGRIVQVGGEHEDAYDPDFCIYNDVFVHAPDGTIAIYAYPQDVFAPTDFHTATLIGDTLWLVGSLGYAEARRIGCTQVYALDTRTFRIEAVATTGPMPGWIHRHRAVRRGGGEIAISGGRVMRTDDGGRGAPPDGIYVLDVRTRQWRRE